MVKVKLIDIHAHAFPDAIAKRAMDMLSEQCEGLWELHGCGTIAGLKRSMIENDIEKSAVCGIATKPGQWKGILRWLMEVMRQDDCFIPFASVHPDDENPAEVLFEIKAAGVKAIKLHPVHQDFIMDEPRMDAIYSAARDAGLLVAFHCGYDIGHIDSDPHKQAGPERLANVAKKFGDMKILATHMGGFLMWDDVEKYLVGSDVYFETSFSLTHMDREQFKRIVRMHGYDKICFGSDWPWMDQGEMRDKVRSCYFGVKPDEKIFRENAIKLLGLE